MPGPNQSKLNAYKSEIAELRKTRPPTSYAEIARILKERHGVEINPSSIWSFVKVRSEAGGRKLKYRLPDEPPAQPLPDSSPPRDDIKSQYLKAQSLDALQQPKPLIGIDPNED